MNKSKDESNRISRLSSAEAKAYLSRLKGKIYDEYRDKWEPWHSMKMHQLPVDNFIVYYLVDDKESTVR